MNDSTPEAPSCAGDSEPRAGSEPAAAGDNEFPVAEQIGQVVHDFNNIVYAMGGYAEVALEDLPLGDPVRSYVVEISRAIERAGDLLARLTAIGEQMQREKSGSTAAAERKYVGGCVLVVDDERAIIDITRKGLERFGFEVVGETDGGRALELLQSDPLRFDVVITDQRMPRITGLELAVRVRSLRPDLPVILATGYAADNGEQALNDAGVDRLVRKPLKTRDLAGIVDDLIRESTLNQGLK